MFLALGLGCGTPEPTEPSEVPIVVKSEPAGDPQDPKVVAQHKSGKRPDGRERLLVGQLTHVEVEGFEALDEEQQRVALAFFNATTGPCEPCMDQGVSLGACLAEADDACGNVGAVARRVVRLVGEGQEVESISAQVEFADAWVPVTTVLEAPVVLVVVEQAGSPLSTAANATWDEVVAACAPHVIVERVALDEVPPSYGVRAAPTAFVNGYRVRGAQQPEAYLRIARAELGDLGLSCPN